jgi:hypothetical protein
MKSIALLLSAIFALTTLPEPAQAQTRGVTLAKGADSAPVF